MEKNYIVKEGVLVDLLKYLATKPFGEVAGLIDVIKQSKEYEPIKRGQGSNDNSGIQGGAPGASENPKRKEAK